MRLGGVPVEEAIKQPRGARASNPFGTFGHGGVPVTKHTLIVKADNYRQCIELIKRHKWAAEHSAFVTGTFGELGYGPVERYDVLKNGVHSVTLQNSNGMYDVIVCKTIDAAYINDLQYMDAMRWAKNCVAATQRDPDFSAYEKHYVYEQSYV